MPCILGILTDLLTWMRSHPEQHLSFILFCLVAFSTLRHGIEIREWQEVSIDLAIPIYPFVFIAAFGSAMLALILLIKTITCLSEVFALWTRPGLES